MPDVSDTVISIRPTNLTYAQACKVARYILTSRLSTRIVIDLTRTHDATTAGFAKLVLLRKQLNQRGCDLVLCGLSGKVAAKHHVCKLENVLPVSA